MLSTKLKEAAGNSADATLYVDDVFSTWLYTGNGSTQTITNGIDLAGKGGLVWVKSRTNTYGHSLTNQVGKYLDSSDIGGMSDQSFISSFNSDGFSLGSGALSWNGSSNYASWTFRKAAKFFDVVTYTGTGSARTIAHSLGVAPGMVIVKRTDTTGDWQVYSNGLTSAAYSIQLNLTAAQASAPTVWNSTAPTSSVFSVGTDATVNASGGTYVAYLFAHNTASDGIIQCGSFTTDASGNATVNLGWEPQYLLSYSRAGGDWQIRDIMRGFTSSAVNKLFPNLANAEIVNTGSFTSTPTATGFSGYFGASQTFIYMAIRRPNKPPTTGTQVYNAIARTGTGGAVTVTGVGFAPDFRIGTFRSAATSKYTFSKLIAPFNNLATNLTRGENIDNTVGGNFYNDGFYEAGYLSTSGHTFIDWLFKRAPGFFDVVCYTGTGVARTVTHNLGVKPDLIIFKKRNSASGSWWIVYASPLGATKYLTLDSTDAEGLYTTTFNDTEPTSTEFTVGTYTGTNGSGNTFVSYLFATLAGISKVGSYTGNGTTGRVINCGFSAGARFICIKATSTTGSWWVWDSARGITSTNDPALQLNSTAAEITSADAIDPSSSGFIVNQEATCSINASGVSYLVWAIA